ncbi:methyltransferase family protein [Humibacillus xanthopallidus]|uniref:Methyltransferase family protein n=1 Tax=Humibacillus xanthopallidus TaxID=412689 RepID=A0A543PNE1_9MICO|nr:class I SAM-dependent methyltransferase [Humibacillus xanthopallidus]TQN45601.1 methyltransferase family protein [Humibacillus xanthopallidus]
MSTSESIHAREQHRLVGNERPGHGHADWEERYAGSPVWSGNPNVALVAEASDLTPGRALDVGCGEGADAVWLARRGWRVTAIDVATNALDRARAAGDAEGVDVDWVASGLVELSDREARFDLVTVFYPALMRTPGRDVEQALLGAVAPGGTLLVVHHANFDREVALSHGFDPDDYVGHDDVVAALGEGWVVECDEQRERDVTEGAGAHHHDDLILRARRLPHTPATATNTHTPDSR